MCKRLGIQHITTTAYHPQANGLVERFHRQLKDTLRARLAAVDWASQLPWILLGLKAAPKEDHTISSVDLFYGVPLTLPGELLDIPEPLAAIFLENLRQTPCSLPTRPLQSQPPSGLPEKVLSADFVFVRRGAPGPPLSPLYEGPYKVAAMDSKFFTLELGGRLEKLTVDRLKPFLAQHVTPANPSRRGRYPAVSS